MRFAYVSLAVLAMVCYAHAACSDITNCESCTNPPLQCYTCGLAETLKVDKTGCLDCPSHCTACTADADNELTCQICQLGYVLDKNGDCLDCGSGCLSCSVNADDEIVCGSCAVHYVQDTSLDTMDCVECPNYCKTCSLDAEGTTVCSACYNMLDVGYSKAYFLKSEDKTCKACPSNCADCADDGNGKGICKTCNSGYENLEDPDDSTRDATKCLKCPTECATCSGIENGAVATCTSCKPDLGLFVDGESCEYCDSDDGEDACKSCDDEGDCTECNAGWRLDDGNCAACPAFCLSCSVDEESGDDVCGICDDGYGVKAITSITCDGCPSNCATCTMDSEGALSCSTCKTGYNKNADGKCTSCPSGCATCSWDGSGSFMDCDSCLAEYIDSPTRPDTGSAASSSNLPYCPACSSNCLVCSDDTTCTSCDDGYVVVTSGSDDICDAVTANCDTEEDDGTTDCDTCDDGYVEESGVCESCPSAKNCMTCDASDGDCLTCFDGYAFVDADFDNTTDTCESCGISKCLNCHARGDYAGNPKKCFECEAGYVTYDTDGVTSNGYEQCKKCPSGCDTCTVDYSDSDKTKCSNGGCWAFADHDKAYANDDEDGCVACPSNCEACTYDSTEEKTICTDGECSTLYAKNDDSGECDDCPDNCEVCEWDASASSIICSPDSCETGYGLNDQNLCDPCPNNCDECEFDTEAEVLLCTTCASGYRDNSDVCGICPSNCLECADLSGSMTCGVCKAGYALRSTDKACVKCPSNCLECDAKATTVTCKKCSSGYGISADKLACTVCSDAAFDNCNLCSSVDSATEVAECQGCSSGYLLKDDASLCLDVSTLDCPGGYEDRGAECSSCSSMYKVTPSKDACTAYCYVCGDIDADSYVEQSECSIGSNSSKTESCVTGSCYGRYKTVDGKKMVVGGCLETECSGAEAAGETCQTAGSTEVCTRCCDGDKCNDFVATLDGIPDSGVVPVISTLLLMVAALLPRLLQ